MSIYRWIIRRKVRGIVRSMRKHYDQGRQIYPDLPLSQLCQDVIGTRYRIFKPSTAEREIIERGIDSVDNIYDAAVLVVLAEANIPIDDVKLFSYVIQETIFEVGTTEGVTKPEDDPDLLERAALLIRRFSKIILNIKSNHGLESTGAPPAAETPETHP